MIVTAWNNGSHHSSGAGYGLKLSAGDRDDYFNREWSSVLLYLPGNSKATEINIAKESFWGATCRELISKDIGLWLRAQELAPWEKGDPPKLQLVPKGGNEFALKRA